MKIQTIAVFAAAAVALTALLGAMDGCGTLSACLSDGLSTPGAAPAPTAHDLAALVPAAEG